MNPLDLHTLDQKSFSFLDLIGQQKLGTWAPADGSGAGLTFTVFGTSLFVTIGKVIIVFGNIQYPVTADGSNAIIGGLPMAPGSAQSAAAGGSSSVATFKSMRVNSALNGIEIFTTSFANMTNANMSGAQVNFYALYLIS